MHPCSLATNCERAAETLHANLVEVKDLFEIKRFALFDQVSPAGGRGRGDASWLASFVGSPL